MCTKLKGPPLREGPNDQLAHHIEYLSRTSFLVCINSFRNIVMKLGPEIDLSVRLSVPHLLRRLWTDCHQTRQVGQGWSNLEP